MLAPLISEISWEKLPRSLGTIKYSPFSARIAIYVPERVLPDNVMVASWVTILSPLVISRVSSVDFCAPSFCLSCVVLVSFLGSLILDIADLARKMPPVTSRARIRPITTATVTSFFTFIRPQCNS